MTHFKCPSPLKRKTNDKTTTVKPFSSLTSLKGLDSLHDSQMTGLRDLVDKTAGDNSEIST